MKLPIDMHDLDTVIFSPRTGQDEWYHPGHYQVQDGLIRVINTSNGCVKLNRTQSIGELRRVYNKTYHRERFKIDKRDMVEDNVDIDKLIIDPDNQFSPDMRQKFVPACRDFSSVFSKRPGAYNGFYGHVDNTINFSSLPPPNQRVYTPDYSPEMMNILADKMDELHRWSVIQTPEEAGVQVEFVSP